MINCYEPWHHKNDCLDLAKRRMFYIACEDKNKSSSTHDSYNEGITHLCLMVHNNKKHEMGNVFLFVHIRISHLTLKHKIYQHCYIICFLLSCFVFKV